MKLEHVPATVALERMQIYTRRGPYTASDFDRMAHTLLSGHMIIYTAYDADGNQIGHTRLDPETTYPVTYVTETTF